MANEIDTGMVYVNIVGADARSCRSAESSDLGRDASWAGLAQTSSSTRR